MNWGTEYYAHPDCEVRASEGWELETCSHPRNWIYWQHGMRENKLMDRRQMVSTVLGILMTALTMCTISYLLYENSQTSWETIAANCNAVIDSGQTEVVINNTCDYYSK